MPMQDATTALSRARGIVAYVDPKGGGSGVLCCAMQAARASGAWLVLYALDEYTPLADPLPGAMAAEGEAAQYGDPLTAEDLARLGRPQLAAIVDQAGALGISAGAWLPREGGVDAMVDYARDHGAEVVLLPSSMPGGSLVDRLVGDTPDEAARQDVPEMPVLFVQPDGAVEHAAARAHRSA